MGGLTGTIGARLLTLNVLLILPVGLISLFLSTATYRIVIRGLEAEQHRLVEDYAVRARIWLRGVLRSVELAVEGVQAAGEGGRSCSAFAASVLRTSPVYKALWIGGVGDPPCFAAAAAAPDEALLRSIAERQRALTPHRTWTGNSLGAFRYDTVEHAGSAYLVVYLKGSGGAEPPIDAVLLVAPDLIDQVFGLGGLEAGAVVGLVRRPSAILAARGADDAGASWLPREWPAAAPARWVEAAGFLEGNIYLTRALADDDFLVVARFDVFPERRAWAQFVLMTVAPMAMVGLLFFLYWRYIRRQVLVFVASIEQAALAEASGRRNAIIPLDQSMPRDIRSVAEAFNRMVRTVEEREDGLRKALDRNAGLMKELHHRVKNSLQVILSFMTLSRRQERGEAARHLAEAEAKVQVLAVAYRHALSEDGLRAIPVAAFISEFAGSTLDIARVMGCPLQLRVMTSRSLVVDHAIPLGLVITELVHRRLTPNHGGIVVTLEDSPEGALELAIAEAGTVAAAPAESRILFGLKSQLRAVDIARREGETLRWRLFV